MADAGQGPGCTAGRAESKAGVASVLLITWVDSTTRGHDHGLMGSTITRKWATVSRGSMAPDAGTLLQAPNQAASQISTWYQCNPRHAAVTVYVRQTPTPSQGIRHSAVVPPELAGVPQYEVVMDRDARITEPVPHLTAC